MRTMFDDYFQPQQEPDSPDNEYQGGVRIVSDRALGLTSSRKKHYNQTEQCFSFAETFKAPLEGVYMAEGNKALIDTHARSDIASNSPSFGNISGTKSPHS